MLLLLSPHDSSAATRVLQQHMLKEEDARTGYMDQLCCCGEQMATVRYLGWPPCSLLSCVLCCTCAGAAEPGMIWSAPATQDALVLVFGYINNDNLKEFEVQRTCALVCHAWRTAAAAACTDLVYVLEELEDDEAKDQQLARTMSFTRWLATHGSSVQHLELLGPRENSRMHREHLTIELPFTQLQQLQSFTCELCVLAEHQDRASSSSSPLSSMTSLTALTLWHVGLDWQAGIQGISALTHLRQLTLDNLRDKDDEEIVDCCSLSCSPLLQLPRLTALTVIQENNSSPVEAAALVAQLTGLRSLELGIGKLPAVGMACLLALTNLTKLNCSYGIQMRGYRVLVRRTCNVKSTVSRFRGCV
jgi:hypothetical protein